jgi:hypothetical protein
MRIRVSRILREQARINPAAKEACERAEAVYTYASHLTAETRYADPERYKDYYVTAAGRKLYLARDST